MNLNVPKQEINGIAIGDLNIGQAVAVSIRPEKVHLVDDDGSKVNNLRVSENELKGRVTATAYIGSDTRVVSGNGNRGADEGMGAKCNFHIRSGGLLFGRRCSTDFCTL